MAHYRLLAHVCSLFLGLALISGTAEGSSFTTPEYNASSGLASMATADAYALGFTGKGVTVAVVDSPFAPQSGEFAGKYPFGIWNEESSDDEHGIHVAGIIAALKNGRGMHGAAFDAGLYPFSAEEWEFTEKAWRTLANTPEVTIINNSWGRDFFLDTMYSSDFLYDLLTDEGDLGTIVELANSLAKADKLVVMAAGNEGHLAPSVTGGLPTALDNEGIPHSLANNWLNVIAYDPREPSSSASFIGMFSNLGREASAYTLLAPGVNIYSTVSDSTYAYESGTSMAVPYVSGVAALAQQAFPYMGGKQLADVLLSTATPIDQANMPKGIMLLHEDYDENEDMVDVGLQWYVPDSAPFPALSQEEKNKLFAEARSIYDESMTDAAIWDEIENALANPFEILPEDEYLSLFGQGMVNAFHAVQGLGYFDANRLDSNEDLSTGEFAGDFAIYGVDTRGFDSVWSNNIGERRMDDPSNDLHGLALGLRKQGGGMLFLTGANTYQGPTVVEGGGISLGKHGYPAGAELAGDVYVRDKGLFTGNGRVWGNLTSSGVLMPGLTQKPGSALTVDKDVESTGVLRLVLWQNGLSNRLNAADITLSGSLELTGGNGGLIRPYADYNNVANASGTLHNSLTAPVTVSAFMSFLPVQTGQSLSLQSQTRALDSLPGVARRTNAVAGGLEHMFHALSGGPLQRRLDYLYNMDKGTFLDTAAEMRGDIQAATLARLPFEGLLMRLLPRRNTAGVPSIQAGSDEFTTTSGDSGTYVWLRPTAGYHRDYGDKGISQSHASTHMIGLVMGAERRVDDLYGGILGAFGNSEVSQGEAEGDILDLRVGLYGGWTPGGFELKALAAAGWQHYKTDRHITVQEGRDHIHSRFDGYTVGGGVEASYNLLHGVCREVVFSPYAGFDLDYIHQEARKESGNKIFALHVRDKDLVRTSMRSGITVGYSPLEWLTLSASGGYRRLISGDRPDLNVSFAEDSSYRFKAMGPDEAKDFVTYEFGVEAFLPHNVKIEARLLGEESHRSASVGGFVNMMFEW